MPFEREMLPDRPEARKKFLRTFWVSKTTHATLTFTRWLVAVLSPHATASTVRHAA